MRLSTDALLLGSWARCYGDKTPSRYLDIGTGTGVLALMLAQRYVAARGVAIDIAAEAVACAAGNFEASPWSSSLSAHLADITVPLPDQLLTPRSVQLIVSNPPYYDGLSPQGSSREQARHTDAGFHPADLFHLTDSIADPHGTTICMVTPVEILDDLRRAAVWLRYDLTALCHIHTTERKAAIRILSQWHRSPITPASVSEQHLILRTADGRYSPEARQLLAPYLLDQYLS